MSSLDRKEEASAEAPEEEEFNNREKFASEGCGRGSLASPI